MDQGLLLSHGIFIFWSKGCKARGQNFHHWDKLSLKASEFGRFSQSLSFSPKCKRLQLTHLTFVDDLLVFVKGSIVSVVSIEEISDYCYYISGLQMNTSKSELFSTGISQSDLERIVELTGMKVI